MMINENPCLMCVELSPPVYLLPARTLTRRPPTATPLTSLRRHVSHSSTFSRGQQRSFYKVDVGWRDFTLRTECKVERFYDDDWKGIAG